MIQVHRTSLLPGKVNELDSSCAPTDDDTSVGTLDTGSSLSVSLLCSPSSGSLRARGVHFPCTATGEVQCQVREIGRFERPADIWWQIHEDEAIRDQALDVLESNPRYSLAGATDRFLEREWRRDGNASSNLLVQMLAAHEVRGLEHHISQRCKSMSTEHVKRVLDIQKKNRNEAILCMASKQTSMPFVQLALLKAQVDSIETRRHHVRRMTTNGRNHDCL